MDTIPDHERIWLFPMDDDIVWCDDPNPTGADEPPDSREFVSAVKHDAIWETLIKLADLLEIDPSLARSAPGKPSDVYATALARLKAQWQAEAIEEMLRDINSDLPPAAMSNQARGCMQLRINELRRQAEAQPYSVEDDV